MFVSLLEANVAPLCYSSVVLGGIVDVDDDAGKYPTPRRILFCSHLFQL